MVAAALLRARALAARHRQLIGFLLVGGANTLLGLALYPALLWTVPVLQRHYITGLLIAQLVSIVFAYFMYKRTVFRTSGNILRELWQFSSFYLVVFAINLGVLPLLVERGGLSPMVAQFGFTLLVTIASYLWNSRVTFRVRANPNPPR